MPAWRSSRALAAALAAAALALAGCPREELEVRPFHLDVRLAGGGALADGYVERTFVTVTGTAHVADATTLVLAATEHGDLTFTFDRAATPELAFPTGIEGRTVTAEIFVDPAGTGASGEPLRIPGYRLSTGGSYELAIGEWTDAMPGGEPAVPPALSGFPIGATVDLPSQLYLSDEWSDWVATDCGLVYLVPLFVQLDQQTYSLDRGERRSFVIPPREEPVQLLHVLSYHRAKACAGRSTTWSQIAAWRATTIQR